MANTGLLATKDWVTSLINKVIKKGFNGYSTDEKRIGTWIDGKPLYRKVLSADNLSITPTQSTNRYASSIDLTQPDVDTVVSYTGKVTTAESNGNIITFFIGTTTMSPDNYVQRSALMLNNVLQFVSIYSGDRLIGYDVIVEYTKITD